jgi:CRISPR-associated exonuclease Cas4
MSISLPVIPSAESEDSLPLSALNDLLFCERRCALHRVEQIWTDNAFTLEGVHSHRRADTAGVESPSGVRTARGVLLRSTRLRLTGKADIIEFHPGPGCTEVPFPVEYKRGRRRRWDNNEVQLCAQAFCLEEMLGTVVPAGALYHIKSRRRQEIAFTAELRARTEDAARRLHELFAAGVTPPPVLKPRCRGCSLQDLCMPQLLIETARLARYQRDLFRPAPSP